MLPIPELLKLHRAQADTTYTAMAKTIGMSRQGLYLIVYGKSHPTTKHIRAIEQMTGWDVFSVPSKKQLKILNQFAENADKNHLPRR